MARRKLPRKARGNPEKRAGTGDLRARNVAFFRGALPGLYRMLVEHSPAGRLVVAESGEPDIETASGLVYGGRLSETVRAELDAFWRAPKRFLLPPMEPGQLDKQGNRFLDGLLRRAKAEGIAFAPAPTSEGAYFLFVLGVGLGQHIDELADRTDCRFLLVADNGVDALHHSLDVYDWPALAGRMRARGGALSFLIEPAPENLGGQMIELLGTVNRCAVDGFAYFVHGDEGFWDQVLGYVRLNQSLVLYGLGFSFDETIMLGNTYLNLSSGEATVFCRPDNARHAVPAFVVASGPSLDASLDFIRDNAAGAVIVSSGSALRALLRNGIVPDFHVELENIAVMPTISDLVEDYDLSRICLVAASSVDHEAAKHFGRAIYFFRPGTSPYPLFCDSDRQCLGYSEPTVVNGSLSFAQEAGFRDILFFGVDLGTKGGGLHHAKDTYHYTEDAIIVDADLRFEVPVPGNFGGTCLTSHGLLMARAQLTKAMQAYRIGYRYRNCSDGALIEGAEPTRAESLALAEIADGKAKTVAAVIDGFPVLDAARFADAWNTERIVAAVRAFQGRFLGIFDKGGRYPDKAYTADVVAALDAAAVAGSDARTRAERAVRIVFRGTLTMMVIAVEHFANRIQDRHQSDRFTTIAAAEITHALEGLAAMAIAAVEDPATGVPTVKADGTADRAIAEIPYTYGDVPRNAQCPCGSGRRFKHCHGKGAT